MSAEDLEWVEWSCLTCRRARRATTYWARDYTCSHGGKDGQLPWVSDREAHAELLKKLGRPKKKENYHPMTIEEINLGVELAKLDRDALNAVVQLSDAQDWKARNIAASKGRDHCKGNVVGWQQTQLAAVNAVLRAIRRGGPYDSRKTMVLMSVAENAVVAQLSKESLTDKEFDLLWGPVGEAVEAVVGQEIPASSYSPTAGRSTPPAETRSARKKAQEKPQEPSEDALRAFAERALNKPAAPVVETPAPAKVGGVDELDSLFEGADTELDFLSATEAAPSVPDLSQAATVADAIEASKEAEASDVDDLDSLLEGVA